MKTAPGIDERYRPATDTEIVLQFRDQGPDEMGRRRFIAHRLEYGPLGDYGHAARCSTPTPRSSPPTPRNGA
jgi:hypothetical protein